MSPTLTIERLSKRFPMKGGELNVLQDISLEARIGDFVVLLGPSGCGKTTILNVMAGFTPYTGFVCLDGETPDQLQRQRRIGMCFQNPTLLPHRNVIRNILLPTEFGRGGISKTEAKHRAEELITLVGLEGFESYIPEQLSGGMAQRVGLARSLMLRPDLLLLDEPFSALDSLTSTRLMIEFYDIIKSQGSTVMMVTHNLTEAAYMADVVYIITPKPGTIQKSVPVRYGTVRSLDLMGDHRFQEVVQECRHAIFNNHTLNSAHS